MADLESKFQRELKNDLKLIFPGCFVMKNDSSLIQGIPDLTVLFPGGSWALLECKRYEHATKQANQKFYINKANDIGGFGAFIFPENREEVLNELQRSFRP